MNFRKNLALLALLLISLTCLTISYLSGHESQVYLFNSDQLYLPTLFTDIFVRNGHLGDWFLTPAPYFFPDFPLFFLAYLTGSDTYSQIAIFAVLQSLALLAVLWLITRQVFRLQAFTLAVTNTVVLIWLALRGGDPFEFLLVSATHYGIFITGLLFLALWLIRESSPPGQRKSLLPLMGAVAFLSTLSDNLFLVQVAVPFAAVALLLDMMHRTLSLQRIITVLTPAACSLAGALSYPWLVSRPTRYATHPGLDSVITNLKASWGIILEAAERTPLFGLILLVYLGLLVYFILNLIKNLRYRQQPSALGWLALFSITSTCATIAAMALSKDLLVVGRYLIAVCSWPVLIVLWSLTLLVKRNLFTTNALLASAAIIATGFGTYQLTKTNGINTHYYPSELACIDDALEEAGARHGVSTYWESKYLQSFSRLELSIATHRENLSEMPWITSQRYFRPTYDFAIISNELHAEPIQRLNKDRSTNLISCGSRSVLISPEHNLRLRKFVNSGDYYQWGACELPSLIGQANSQCGMEKKSLAQAGFLTFGPYEPLPAGQYRLTLSYVSNEQEQAIVGEWDALVHIGKSDIILAKGTLSGSSGTVRQANSMIDIDSTQNLGVLEVRTQAHVQKSLSIQSLRIERLR